SPSLRTVRETNRPIYTPPTMKGYPKMTSGHFACLRGSHNGGGDNLLMGRFQLTQVSHVLTPKHSCRRKKVRMYSPVVHATPKCLWKSTTVIAAQGTTFVEILADVE